MISFNLTALTRETPFIQRKVKTRIIFPRKTFQNFTQLSFTISMFNKNSRFTSSLFSLITALKHFKKKAMADMTTTFRIEEDEQPMAREPIYLSSDEIEYSTPNTTPDHQLECIYPDSINQLIASQLEQRSNMGMETIFYPPTPNTSMISDDEDLMNLTPIIGNPEQYTPQIPPRRNHPIQLCQHVQPIPDTPESPTPENRGRSDNFLSRQYSAKQVIIPFDLCIIVNIPSLQQFSYLNEHGFYSQEKADKQKASQPIR